MTESNLQWMIRTFEDPSNLSVTDYPWVHPAILRTDVRLWRAESDDVVTRPHYVAWRGYIIEYE